MQQVFQGELTLQQKRRLVQEKMPESIEVLLAYVERNGLQKLSVRNVREVLREKVFAGMHAPSK